jgi:hypothetical protein
MESDRKRNRLPGRRGGFRAPAKGIGVLKAPNVGEERGASAVEFAIIASLLLMIVFGTITFGLVLNRFQGLQAAGREGARLASITQSTMNDIRNRSKDSLSIIAASAIQNSCTGWGQAIETGCVEIEQRQDNNADGDTADGGERTSLNGQAGTYQPCGTVPPQGRSIYVELRYRLRIEIPLWASPQMTISGAGEFKCE